MTASSEILFISDLHLDQSKPEITQNFLSFIETRATQARVLYILGDLFEVWLGDDDEALALEVVFTSLQKLSKTIEVFFIHGNRDFLLGQEFASRIGMTIIQEPTVIQLGSRKVGLMHGDLLCTDDVDYQNFRNSVRYPAWQQQFLAQSLSDRQAIAANLRNKSAKAMKTKNLEIMDVNQDSVLEYFNTLDIDVLIHGHTHRPGIHEYPEHKKRLVLGDWSPQASFISWRDDKFELVDARI